MQTSTRRPPLQTAQVATRNDFRVECRLGLPRARAVRPVRAARREECVDETPQLLRRTTYGTLRTAPSTARSAFPSTRLRAFFNTFELRSLPACLLASLSVQFWKSTLPSFLTCTHVAE